ALMDPLWTAMLIGLLILMASVTSVELAVSVALIEISLGVLAGNVLALSSPPWMDFLASFGGIVLTFLAGAEVDRRAMREKLRESLLIGGLSFVVPFAGVWAFCAWVLGWSTEASQIGGVALSTTSLAVVYAVLVETGLTHTPIGKLIMAATFVTDLGVAVALALLFVHPTWWLVPFAAASALVIWAMVALQPWFFARYGERVIEPELKGAFAALLVLMFFAERAQSHAVLPAFILGLALAPVLTAGPWGPGGGADGGRGLARERSPPGGEFVQLPSERMPDRSSPAEDVMAFERTNSLTVSEGANHSPWRRNAARRTWQSSSWSPFITPRSLSGIGDMVPTCVVNALSSGQQRTASLMAANKLRRQSNPVDSGNSSSRRSCLKARRI